MEQLVKCYRVPEIKADKAAFTVEGYPAVFDVVDMGNDFIPNGACDDWIDDTKNSKSDTLYLWQHDTEKPWGHAVDYSAESKGLFTKSQVIENEFAKEHFPYIGTTVKDMSIGYIAKDYHYDKTMPGRNGMAVRVLDTVWIKEWSAVTFGMAGPQGANVTGKKSDSPWPMIESKAGVWKPVPMAETKRDSHPEFSIETKMLLMENESISDLGRALDAAVNEMTQEGNFGVAVGDKDTYRYASHVYDGWLVVNDWSDDKYWRVNFTRDADGTFTLSDPVEVEREIVWKSSTKGLPQWVDTKGGILIPVGIGLEMITKHMSDSAQENTPAPEDTGKPETNSGTKSMLETL